MKIFFSLFAIIFVSSIAAQQVPSYVPTNSLTGWYAFSGNANDLSGNANNGVVSGAMLTTDANAVPNSAYLFSSGAKIVTPIHPQSAVSGASITSSFALFTWFNANNIGSTFGPNSFDGLGHCLISSDSAGYGGFALGVINGSLTACVGVHWLRKAFQFNTGTWYHVGLNFNANNQVAELFVNAVSIGTINVMPPFQNVDPCLYQMGFVSNPGTWNVPFSGKMDEPGIWKRALTRCEINQLYQKSVFSVSVQPQSQTVTNGNSAFFSCASNFLNTTYQWQANSGAGFINLSNSVPYNGVFTATLSVTANNQNNNYTYRCILTSGNCTLASNPATLKVNIETGIGSITQDQIESFDGFYPNPSLGVFYTKNFEKTQIIIYNSLGQVVFENHFEEGKQSIDLSDQPEGFYFIQKRTNTNLKVLKVLIED